MKHLWMRIAAIAWIAGFSATLVLAFTVVLAAIVRFAGANPPGIFGGGILLSVAIAVVCGAMVLLGAGTIGCTACGRSLFDVQNIPKSQASFAGGRALTIALRLARGKRHCSNCGALN
jgi:hypothetical protein